METLKLQDFFDSLLERIQGLQMITVSDRDGVPILISTNSNNNSGRQLHADSAFASTYALAVEQASKLRHGDCQGITSFYKDKVIVHTSYSPLLVSYLGDNNLNVGLIHSLHRDVKCALEDVRGSLDIA